MSEHAVAIYCPAKVEEWNRLLRPYAKPATWRSLSQLLLTLALFFLCFAAMVLLDGALGYWACLPLALPTGLFLVRVFIIQHDCGHRSFFRQRWACDAVGRVLGVLTLTPYHWWKRDHDRHHASAGDLSRRGSGDIDTLTVSEYRALSVWRRRCYRLYRHPLMLFGVGPLYQFLVRHRLPLGLRKGDRRALFSILGNDLAVGSVLLCAGAVLGFGRLGALWLPVMAIAAIVGVWIFFVQHQFETTYWADRPGWSFVTAALKGCSYYRLPRVLEWLTGSIGYHHIHHLAARIPNYRLRSCFEAIPSLRQAQVIGLWQSFGCARLALWSEEQQRLLSFREALA
jgi:omega-6 fatty acid desaturase (delta-12 desaturase)